MIIWDMAKSIAVSTFAVSTVSTASTASTVSTCVANMSSSDNAETNKVEPTSVLELRVRFPTGKFTQRVFEVPKELRGRFPTEQFSALEISLHDGAFVEVDSFGLPFHNTGHA